MLSMTQSTGKTAKTALDLRLNAVRAARGWTDEQWSALAGLSTNYLRQQRFEARRNPGFRLPERGAEALARAAQVRVDWLRTGRGEMDAPDEGTEGDETPPVAPLRREVERPRGAAELALVRALQLDPGRYTPAAFLAALDAVRSNGAAKLPNDEAAATAVMSRVLDASARAIRDGRAVTLTGLLWEALGIGGGGDAADESAEGIAQLRELGVEPPDTPVPVKNQDRQEK